MKELFEDNNTLWLNLRKAFNRRRNDKEKYIEVNFELRADELAEAGGLAIAVAIMMNTFVLPDTTEYDTFTDFLLFFKEISDALPKEKADAETAQLSLMVYEREIKAVDWMLSQGMRILGRDQNLTSENADKAILIESFRRRILKAAESSPPQSPPRGEA